MAEGLSRDRLLGRDLARPFQGVYVAKERALSLQVLCDGLARRLDPTAFFCGITAARLLGVPLPHRVESSPLIHVGVPSPRYRPVGRGLVGHAFAIAKDDIRTWSGLRLTSPERTWCDLSAVLSVSDLVAAGDYLIQWRLPMATPESLAAATRAHAGQRGVTRARLALPFLDGRSESPQESRLRYLLVCARLGELVANLPITTSGGYRYRADLAFPAHKVIIEYRSGFHDSPAAFRADMTRVSRLEADGWKVILVNGDDLDNPEELVGRIRRVLRARASR